MTFVMGCSCSGQKSGDLFAPSGGCSCGGDGGGGGGGCQCGCGGEGGGGVCVWCACVGCCAWCVCLKGCAPRGGSPAGGGEQIAEVSRPPRSKFSLRVRGARRGGGFFSLGPGNLLGRGRPPVLGPFDP